MKMRVKDLLKMLGDGLYCIFDIIWDFEEDGKEEVKEHSVKTEDIKAVAELFGEWEVAKEDSLFVTPKDENTVLITIYVYNPKTKTKETVATFEDKEIVCPQCGAEHDSEDDTEENKHQCFYCGCEWIEEEKCEKE